MATRRQFHDRTDAGRKLAFVLEQRGLEGSVVVLGIPRGGLPVAAEVARALDAPLGVVVARKIGAPWDEELAIGATTANGATYLDASIVRHTRASAAYIEAARDAQIEEARRREKLFFARGRPRVQGAHAVIVDDGLATGATAIAALRSVKAAGARRTTLAVPVGAPTTLERVAGEADDVVCLLPDPELIAVGQYYDDFTQVTDEEALAILEHYAPRGASSRSG